MRYRRTLIAPDPSSCMISKKIIITSRRCPPPVRVLPGGDLLAGRGPIEGSGGVIRQEKDQVWPTMLMLARVRERLQRMFRGF